MKDKTYRIENLTDIINATDENNIDNFIKDLKGVLLGIYALRETSKVLGVEDGIDYPEFYEWTDDGKHDIKLTLNPKQ